MSDATTTSWPVTRDEQPHALAVTTAGLVLTAADEQQERFAWGDLRAVHFPDGFAVRFVAGGESVVLRFHAGAAQRELRAELHRYGVATTDARDETPLGQSRPGAHPVMTALDRAAAEARALVGMAFVTGIVLSVVGSAVLAAAWPDEVSDEGSGAIAFVGGLTGFAGSCLVLVAVVAWGVRLGIESAQPRRR